LEPSQLQALKEAMQKKDRENPTGKKRKTKARDAATSLGLGPPKIGPARTPADADREEVPAPVQPLLSTATEPLPPQDLAGFAAGSLPEEGDDCASVTPWDLESSDMGHSAPLPPQAATTDKKRRKNGTDDHAAIKAELLGRSQSRNNFMAEANVPVRVSTASLPPPVIRETSMTTSTTMVTTTTTTYMSCADFDCPAKLVLRRDPSFMPCPLEGCTMNECCVPQKYVTTQKPTTTTTKKTTTTKSTTEKTTTPEQTTTEATTTEDEEKADIKSRDDRGRSRSPRRIVSMTMTRNAMAAMLKTLGKPGRGTKGERYARLQEALAP
jgi:hypothetical protein